MTEPRRIPTENELRDAGALHVYDGEGNKVLFSELFADQKTIVVFIRHFFCGRCQEYVLALAQIPENRLQELNTRIVVIGCGEWQPIKSYSERIAFKGAMYADPSRNLYHALGMDIEKLATTPAGEAKRSYIRTNLLSVTLSSIWHGPVSHPNLIGKSGNISQLGGEFILGPGNVCSFASRMQHTEDHVEVEDLLKAVEESQS
ncbi:hypothetical protein NP233_g1869 [Leucocoprinus birnbaumii]|uniref:Thioredoxin-like protein AAED1 n=1 Tax=Leucocoprinus birnbaumii TaxID=56174 RepID=A0AAD5YVE2_9AGAR|nr:hypothetical protein NP233_g1869 [Leucocoprinus birnbaumii]